MKQNKLLRMDNIGIVVEFRGAEGLLIGLAQELKK